MPFNIHQKKGHYLHNLLRDGVKPFLYRSRICLLLGASDNTKSQFLFSLTLPPVGFKYLNNPFINELPIPQSPLSDIAQEKIKEVFSQKHVTEKVKPQQEIYNLSISDSPESTQWNQSHATKETLADGLMKHFLSSQYLAKETEMGVSGIPESEALDQHKMKQDIDGSTKNVTKSLIEETERIEEHLGSLAKNVAKTSYEIDGSLSPPVERRHSKDNSFSENQAPHVRSSTEDNAVDSKEIHIGLDTKKSTVQSADSQSPKELATQNQIGVETNIEIPGVSKKRTFFSALSPQKESPLHQNTSQTKSDEKNRTHQQRESVGKSNQEAHLHVRSGTEDNAVNSNDISFGLDTNKDTVQSADSQSPRKRGTQNQIGVETNIEIPGVSKKRTFFPTFSSQKESPLQQNISPIKPDKKNRDHQQREKVEKSNQDALPRNVQKSEGPLFTLSYRKAYEKIEQLRHAMQVHQTKVSSKPLEMNEKPKQKQVETRMLQPIEEIFIIKTPSFHSRIPDAFWERSGLSHFHLRPIR